MGALAAEEITDPNGIPNCCNVPSKSDGSSYPSAPPDKTTSSGTVRITGSIVGPIASGLVITGSYTPVPVCVGARAGPVYRDVGGV